MMHDTTKDCRILTAQLACALLKKNSKQKPGVALKMSRDKLAELASASESAVMTLLYMYQEPAILTSSEPVMSLLDSARKLSDAYKPLIDATNDGSLLRAQTRWCIRTLAGLQKRFSNSGQTMASGIDIVVVHVRTVTKEGDFFKTRVTDGTSDYTVMTNLSTVGSDSQLAAAFLPPREIGGTVSETMYLGDRLRDEPVGTLLSEEQVDAKDAAGILYDEVSKQVR
jgi:predicted RNA-binding protein with EMAP domain